MDVVAEHVVPGVAHLGWRVHHHEVEPLLEHAALADSIPNSIEAHAQTSVQAGHALGKVCRVSC